MSNPEQFNPTDRISQLLITLGNAYLDRQQYPEAFEKFDQLIERGIQTPEIMNKAAISAIGANYSNDKALAIYKKALENDQDSSALIIGLATLFAQNNVVIPFAFEVCENALKLNPANAQKIHLFLKKAYAESGHEEKVYEHEQKVIFGSNNKKAIRSYLESLWWEGKFEEAHRSLTTAYEPQNQGSQFDVERALTYAYSIISRKDEKANKLERSNIEAGLKQINTANSLFDLRSYLTLKSCLPDDDEAEKKLNEDLFEEYQFILGNVSLDDALQSSNGFKKQEQAGKFNFIRDILNQFPKLPRQNNDFSDNTAVCVSFMQIFTHGANQVSEKLIKLVEEHLSDNAQNMSIRQAGIGYIVLSCNVPDLIDTLTRLLQHLDDYNQKTHLQYRISLLSSIWITNLGAIENEREKLIQFLRALHLSRIVELNITRDAGAGMLLLAGDVIDNKLISKDLGEISILKRGPVDLLPSQPVSYYEIMWKTALDSIREGESYYLGRFEVKNCLTKHQTYATYKAFDEQLSRSVLIKVLMIKESIRFLEDANARQILFDQIRGIGRLNHPHITNLYDMGEHKNMFYYVREYVDGKQLNEIDWTGEDFERKILETLQKLVRALAYAQHQNILHLNLKPANIWINEVGEISLTDFRLEGFTENLVENGKVLYPGYWRYLAPEMFGPGMHDLRSDIYSFGIITYELLTGQHPYDSANSRIKGPKDIKKLKIKKLSDFSLELCCEAWQKLIDKTLAFKVENRFNSYSQIDMELRKIQLELMASSINS